MPEFLLLVLSKIWSTLLAMAPYLMIGFLVAGVLSVFISPAWVERRLGGRGPGAIMRASLFGVPLPLCSCGVIPVAASLRRNGASKGATMAFLLSTPQTGVDSIMATFSLLGPVFAVFRPIVAFLTGVLGGVTIEALGADPADTAPATVRSGACGACADDASGSKPLRIARYALITLPRDIAKPLLIGLLAAGLISAVVPADFFAGRWGSGLSAMLAMMLMGMPLYVCATSSIPIAAAMIGIGLSPGAALVFLMTGPATNAAAITTVWKLFGRRTAALYLAVVAVSALGSGLILDWVYRAGDFTPGQGTHRMLPPNVQIVLALMLLGVLIHALIPRRSRPVATAEAGGDESTVVLTIDGMRCSQCEETLRRALLDEPGVTDVTVSRAERQAVLRGQGYDLDHICQTIASLGYSAHAADVRTTI